jgi:hypothetical protein
MIITKRLFASTLLRQAQIGNGAELLIKCGDIAEEPVDVIMSCANSDLIHDDGLALDLVEKGG